MNAVLAEIFGPDLIIVVVVVVVVLFGGTQIPKIARSLGSAQSEFKKGLAEGSKGTKDEPPGTTATDTTPHEGGGAAASG